MSYLDAKHYILKDFGPGFVHRFENVVHAGAKKAVAYGGFKLREVTKDSLENHGSE